MTNHDTGYVEVVRKIVTLCIDFLPGKQVYVFLVVVLSEYFLYTLSIRKSIFCPSLNYLNFSPN